MLSNHLAGALLEASVKGTGYAGGAPTFLALLHTPAVREDDGTELAAKEVDYSGYARASVAGAIWGTASEGRLVNVTAVALPTCIGGAGATVRAWALCTTAIGGEVLHYGDVTEFVIDTSDPSPQIPAGLLVLLFANPTR